MYIVYPSTPYGVLDLTETMSERQPVNQFGAIPKQRRIRDLLFHVMDIYDGKQRTTMQVDMTVTEALEDLISSIELGKQPFQTIKLASIG